jgi:hypothetical protein
LYRGCTLPPLHQKLAGFRSRLPALAYVTTVALFLWLFSGFYLPGKGFTALLLIGDKGGTHALPQLLAEKPYIEPDSDGYDGQFYVQIAMQPDLHNEALQHAIDNLPYRARRILVPWTAWLLGGGDPGRTMHVFSVVNLVCWLALAWVLLRWFPPTGWSNFLRWSGVLFSFGLFFSVRGSLTDGPTLLLTACGMALLETARPAWAAVTLGACGLARETGILAVGTFFEPGKKTWSERLPGLVRGAFVVLPCVVWFLYLNVSLGTKDAGGVGNFSLPFQSFAVKWWTTLDELFQRGVGIPNDRSLLLLLALTTQLVFFAARPRPNEAWWRLGAAYTVLLIILGPAVWEGYPGAAARTLLPMGLAFNVLVPRGRRWLAVLLLGNATMFCSIQSLQYPGGDSYEFANVPSVGSNNTREWKVEFGNDWYAAKRSQWEYWRWSRGDAHITVSSPLIHSATADVSFSLKSRDSREVTLQRGSEILWRGKISPSPTRVKLQGVTLMPGAETWMFSSGRTEEYRDALGRREVICLRNLRFELLGVARKP